MEGFAEAAGVFSSAGIWLLMVGAVLWGMFIGALPGVNMMIALVLFLPFTFYLSMNEALVGLVAMYVSSIYAGSIPAILINIPGTGASIITTIDGYPMSQQGRAGQALGCAAVSSWVGTLVTALILIGVGPSFVKFALKFGTQEIFMVALWGFVLSVLVPKGNKLKNLVAGCIGLLLACIGISARYELPRFTWESSYLLSGVDIVAACIGLYAVAVVLENLFEEKQLFTAVRQQTPKISGFIQTLKPGVWPIILFAALTGFIVGVIPGTGAIVAALITYGIISRISKHRNEFGKGRFEGVLVPETANNAVSPGATLTTLVLGVPGSGEMVIFLGAFTLHGLRCGPRLLVQHPEFLYVIFLSFIAAAFITLILAWISMKFWCKVIEIPKGYLWPAVLLLCVLGTYFTHSNMNDVLMMLSLGILAFFGERAGFSKVPILMGLVLGPILEVNLGVALQLASPLAFFTEPISLGLFILTLITSFGLIWLEKRAPKTVEV